MTEDPYQELEQMRAFMRGQIDQAHASLRMVRDTIEELFGHLTKLESEEAVLRRGPELHHEAEAIVDALRRLATHLEERDRRE